MTQHRLVALACFALMALSVIGAAVTNSFALEGPSLAFGATAILSLGLGLVALGQEDDDSSHVA